MGLGMARLRRAARLYIDEPAYRVRLSARIIAFQRRRRFRAFGTDSIVHRPNWIYGPHQIEIGDEVLILHGAWLSVERPAWDAEGPVLQIGDGVGCRPNCTISASESIVIEDNVIMAWGCTVIDSDHTIGDPAESVLSNPMVTSPIRIGRGTWLGDRVSVLRGADIGCYCKIGANSVVRGSIPDYSVAVGAPARVVGSTRPEEPET